MVLPAASSNSRIRRAPAAAFLTTKARSKRVPTEAKPILRERAGGCEHPERPCRCKLQYGRRHGRILWQLHRCHRDHHRRAGAFGGSIYFRENSSADQSDITAVGGSTWTSTGGNLYFKETASAGSAFIGVNGGQGSGTAYLGSINLEIGGNNFSDLFQGLDAGRRRGWRLRRLADEGRQQCAPSHQPELLYRRDHDQQRLDQSASPERVRCR